MWFPGIWGVAARLNSPSAERRISSSLAQPTVIRAEKGVRYFMGYSLESSNLPNFFALDSRDRRRR